MLNIRDAAIATLFLALTMQPGFAQAPPVDSVPATTSTPTDKVDDYIRMRMEKEHIPGLSLAVVRAGKLIKAKGYGHASLELKADATPDTVYKIGSLSKQFTAAAIMLLVQEKKVALDDQVGKYLDGTPEAWKGITLRHLLSHTSGLPMDGIVATDKTMFADFTREELLDSAKALPLLSSPGERFAYSNLGFDLLALVIEKVSGKTYEDFTRERIFAPLGMTATRINDRHAIVPNRAQGALWIDGRLQLCEQLSPTRFRGSGSILSTALDLANWDAALASDVLLSDASRKAMWTRMTLKDGKATDYGLGWSISSVKGHTNVNHNGAINGYLANMSRFIDDKLTVIVLANQSGLADTVRIARGIARLYIPAIRPKEPPLPSTPPENQPRGRCCPYGPLRVLQ